MDWERAFIWFIIYVAGLHNICQLPFTLHTMSITSCLVEQVFFLKMISLPLF